MVVKPVMSIVGDALMVSAAYLFSLLYLSCSLSIPVGRLFVLLHLSCSLSIPVGVICFVTIFLFVLQFADFSGAVACYIVLQFADFSGTVACYIVLQFADFSGTVACYIVLQFADFSGTVDCFVTFVLQQLFCYICLAVCQFQWGSCLFCYIVLQFVDFCRTVVAQLSIGMVLSFMSEVQVPVPITLKELNTDICRGL